MVKVVAHYYSKGKKLMMGLLIFVIPFLKLSHYCNNFPKTIAIFIHHMQTQNFHTYGLTLENANLGPILVLFGPWEVLKLEQRSVHYLGPEKNTGDDDGALSLKAYHISHCDLC